ncbi:hypothetical protein YC2023_008314 [Brassica napus]
MWISKGPEFESAPRQISTARSHQGFHILSPSNGLPFVVGWSRSSVDSQRVRVRIRTTLDFHRVIGALDVPRTQDLPFNNSPTRHVVTNFNNPHTRQVFFLDFNASHVIGHIVEVSHVEVISVNGKDTQKLSLELRNQELPKDDMALAIVDPKPLALTNGVSDKDDFFIHTPRKSIADVKASRQGSETFKAIDNSIVSDAPEGSMMLRGCSSQQSDSTSLTPAKRIGAPVINLDETFDQTSVTRTNCPVKIKKEKKDKSG